MRRGRRLCVCIGAATAAAIILLACASLAESGAATARMAALKRPDSAAAPTTGFSGSRISFRYPAGWQAESDPEDVSNFWALVVYLSNQPLHPPCAITIDSKTCGPPLSRLSKGSILAVWSEDAFPGWTFKRARGMPLRVGGHRAKLRLTRSACGVGAKAMLDVVVDRPDAPDNWFEFRACMTRPGIASRERQIRTLLSTVHFGS